MEYCELLIQNSLRSLEILGWLIDLNLAIAYLPTNVFIKKKSKLLKNTKYLNISGNSKQIIFVKLVYHKHHYVRPISVKSEQFSPSQKGNIP